jgi:hypothetical protein
MRYAQAFAVLLVLAGSVSLAAQWPRFQDTAVPRDAQGRVRIDAPPPRAGDGKPEIDVTIDDAKAFTKPVTVRINQRVVVDEEPIEFICNENQQFRQRIKIR